MKLAYRMSRLVSGTREKVLRRFTKPGLAVLGGAAISAAMGPDVEHNVAYQAFSILSAMLLVSIVWTFFFRGKFIVERVLPKYGTVGHPLQYTVRVKNCTSRRQAGLFLLEDLEESTLPYKEWLLLQLHRNRNSFRLTRVAKEKNVKPAVVTEAHLPAILREGEGEGTVELLPLRRGLLRFSGATIARPDPLGLMRAFLRINAPQTLLVLPRRYALPSLALPGSMKYQEGGVAMASHVGQSEDFVALRDYRHGDPLRHIHWRSWARVGRPVVKEFEDEFFVRHALVLDTFASFPFSEAFEEAVSVAASFACTINTQESLLDLLFVGPQSFCFTAGRGLAHADQMLAILASVQPCRDKPFVSLEHLVLNHVQAVSGCICVLLSWDAARREFVRKLRALGIPLLVLIMIEEDESEVTIDPGPMRDQPQRFLVVRPGKVEQALTRLHEG